MPIVGPQIDAYHVAWVSADNSLPNRTTGAALPTFTHSGKHPRARAADELRAGEFLLAIAGVRASDVASQEPVKEILSAPVNVNVVIGVMPATYPDVIDGEARLVTES